MDVAELQYNPTAKDVNEANFHHLLSNEYILVKQRVRVEGNGTGKGYRVIAEGKGKIGGATGRAEGKSWVEGESLKEEGKGRGDR